MSTTNGDDRALDARDAAHEARLVISAYLELERIAGGLHERVTRLMAVLPRTNMRHRTRSFAGSVGTCAGKAARGLADARADLERLAEMQVLERAVRGAGG